MTMTIEITRRQLGLVAAAGMAAPIALADTPARPKMQRRSVFYTVQTAPDQLSRDILARSVRRIGEGTPAGMPGTYGVSQNFQQIIEQNFARLMPLQMASLVGGLGDIELARLAQAYGVAVVRSG